MATTGLWFSPYEPTHQDFADLENADVAPIIDSITMGQEANTSEPTVPGVGHAEDLKGAAREIIEGLHTQRDCLLANPSGACQCTTDETAEPLTSEHLEMFKASGLDAHVDWLDTRTCLIFYSGGPHPKLRAAIIKFDRLMQDQLMFIAQQAMMMGRGGARGGVRGGGRGRGRGRAR